MFATATTPYRNIMTNLLSTLTYVTLTDARDTSSTLSPVWDQALTDALCQAQLTVDNYIWSYGTKEDEDQALIFPVEDEWIPNEIKIATIRIAEQIYLEGNSLWSLRGDKVVSEGNLSRSIAYSDKQKYNDYVETLQIPKKALKILNKYRNPFISQVI